MKKWIIEASLRGITVPMESVRKESHLVTLATHYSLSCIGGWDLVRRVTDKEYIYRHLLFSAFCMHNCPKYSDNRNVWRLKLQDAKHLGVYAFNHCDWICKHIKILLKYVTTLPASVHTLVQQLNAFENAYRIVKWKPPSFVLLLLNLKTLHTNEEVLYTCLKKAAQRKEKKKLLCSFLCPPLSLFPTLPKVLLGNRSQVFNKPVVDMTAVQSSV